MRFIDEARVYVQAGKGGDGAIAFLREKFRPFGGPAGGDGGRGGNVIFEVDEGLATLLDFKYTPRLVARDGEAGRGKQQYGHQGDDLVVRVPPGTIVFDEESGAPRTANRDARHLGRSTLGQDRIATRRRGWSGRSPECGQIDPARRPERGASENCLLPFHDSHAQS